MMEKAETREGMFRELVESSGDITIVTDRDFKIRYISSSVTDLYGQEPIALLGKTIFDFVSEQKAVKWQACLTDLTEPVRTNISLTLPINRGKRFYTAQVTNQFDDLNVRGLIVKLHDITEIKNREQELIESNLHLDQVFYKTTHDLRAPLQSVLGLVNLAEQSSDEERGEYIGLIRKSLLKLDGFVEEMNNFFRGERLEIKREKIDLQSLISEEIDNLRSFHEMERIKIELDIDNKVDFYSDLFRVRTIITNLITNAIKYSDLAKRWPFIRIEAIVKSQQCEIKVQDNGIGIDAEYREKIFERFFRATTHSQGTGLGLFIVNDTVQRLSGTIDVSSLKDVGTTFGVVIPNQTHRTVL